MQDGNIKLFQTVEGGEIAEANGLLEMDCGLETMVYLSLFGGNEDDDRSDNNIFNWWGNIDEVDPCNHYRSETQYLLQSLPLTTKNLLRLESAAKTDLQCFLDKKIASSINATVSIIALNTVKFIIDILAEGEESTFEFTENWKACPIIIPDETGVVSTTLIPSIIKNISQAVYTGKSNDIFTSSGITSPTGIALNSTGTFCHIDSNSTDSINQGVLSTPFDISTLGVLPVAINIAFEDGNSRDWNLPGNGARGYMLGDTTDKIYQYNLSTPGNASTGSYSTKFFDVSAQATSILGFYISPDETKLFVADSTSKKIFQYTIVTPGDISTAVYDTVFLDVSLQTPSGFITGMSMGFNGIKLYTIDTNTANIFQYSLPTPYSLVGAFYEDFYNVTQEAAPLGIFFNADTTKFWVSGFTVPATIYQYTL